MLYHNAYGRLMVEATRDGVMAHYPDRRPFVLTRANILGGHRYAATWTGDNWAGWDHLKLSVPMSLTLGLSGQPSAVLISAASLITLSPIYGPTGLVSVYSFPLCVDMHVPVPTIRNRGRLARKLRPRRRWPSNAAIVCSLISIHNSAMHTSPVSR